MDYPEVMKKAENFAEANLKECAAEMLEWRETSILRNGKVRELAAILHTVDPHYALTLAGNMIKTAAMRKVVAE